MLKFYTDKKYNILNINILKIDIEGSEKEVFEINNDQLDIVEIAIVQNTGKYKIIISGCRNENNEL